MVRHWLRWRTFWSLSGAVGDTRQHFRELDARYREPHRFYHTWQHILTCLQELDRTRRLCADAVAVELSLWYHDAVYDPRAKDNEQRSASLARKAALGMGLGKEVASKAQSLVLATAHTGEAAFAESADGDTRIVMDIDLAILGAAPRRFAAYEAAIRREYRSLAEAEYQEGRTLLLRSFLARPRIYLTEPFRERLESRARDNIASSISRLAGQSR
jgi:predicted metal-dependent HD superfamily phosphohydrolase